MKAQYLAVGKTHSAIRQFKLDWAEKQLDNEKAKRRRIREQTRKDFASGKYKPFGKIVVDQGNDPPAYVAAVNICKSAIDLWRKGITLGGRPYLKYNWRSQRTVFDGISLFACVVW